MSSCTITGVDGVSRGGSSGRGVRRRLAGRAWAWGATGGGAIGTGSTTRNPEPGVRCDKGVGGKEGTASAATGAGSCSGEAGGKGARLTVIGLAPPSCWPDSPKPIDRISACASSDSSRPMTIRRLARSCAQGWSVGMQVAGPVLLS
ncbi:hypothetical protein [Massilia suwonensis]|uniref:Uncharacterized protein n=1 Tax=Massilia suwonensis TaxID=648895 RepID=A0ABW0MTU9_9BURK